MEDQTETVDELTRRIIELLHSVTQLKSVDWGKHRDGEKEYIRRVNLAVTDFINPCQDLKTVP